MENIRTTSSCLNYLHLPPSMCLDCILYLIYYKKYSNFNGVNYQMLDDLKLQLCNIKIYGYVKVKWHYYLHLKFLINYTFFKHSNAKLIKKGFALVLCFSHLIDYIILMS